MARTLEQQLDDLDAAIATIERGAQEYTLPDGTIVKAADLSTLYGRRDRVESQIKAASRGAVFRPVAFRRPLG